MHSLGIFFIYIRLTVEIFVTYTQPFIFDWWIDILERQSVSETVSPSERFETPVFVDHFSYQDKTFPVPCFRILDLAVTPPRSRDLIWSDNMFLQLQLQQDLLDKNIQGTCITYASISVSGDPYKGTKVLLASIWDLYMSLSLNSSKEDVFIPRPDLMSFLQHQVSQDWMSES